jgi:hypothetical protein
LNNGALFDVSPVFFNYFNRFSHIGVEARIVAAVAALFAVLAAEARRGSSPLWRC